MQSAMASGPQYFGGAGRKIQKARGLPSGAPPLCRRHPHILAWLLDDCGTQSSGQAQQVPSRCQGWGWGSGQNLFPIPSVWWGFCSFLLKAGRWPRHALTSTPLSQRRR